MKFFSVLLSSFLFKLSLNMKQESLVFGVFKNISFVIVVSIVSLKGFAMDDIEQEQNTIMFKLDKGNLLKKLYTIEQAYVFRNGVIAYHVVTKDV